VACCVNLGERLEHLARLGRADQLQHFKRAQCLEPLAFGVEEGIPLPIEEFFKAAATLFGRGLLQGLVAGGHGLLSQISQLLGGALTDPKPVAAEVADEPRKPFGVHDVHRLQVLAKVGTVSEGAAANFRIAW